MRCRRQHWKRPSLFLQSIVHTQPPASSQPPRLPHSRRSSLFAHNAYTPPMRARTEAALAGGAQPPLCAEQGHQGGVNTQNQLVLQRPCWVFSDYQVLSPPSLLTQLSPHHAFPNLTSGKRRGLGRPERGRALHLARFIFILISGICCRCQEDGAGAAVGDGIT